MEKLVSFLQSRQQYLKILPNHQLQLNQLILIQVNLISLQNQLNLLNQLNLKLLSNHSQLLIHKLLLLLKKVIYNFKCIYPIYFYILGGSGWGIFFAVVIVIFVIVGIVYVYNMY